MSFADTHTIQTQLVIYHGEYLDERTTLVVCTCGEQFEEIPMGLRDSSDQVAATILKHKIDVLARKLGVSFLEGELPQFVHEE